MPWWRRDRQALSCGGETPCAEEGSTAVFFLRFVFHIPSIPLFQALYSAF